MSWISLMKKRFIIMGGELIVGGYILYPSCLSNSSSFISSIFPPFSCISCAFIIFVPVFPYFHPGLGIVPIIR